MKGLFVNNKAAKDSIHASGIMVFDCLKHSEKFALDYIEISEEAREIPLGYHFYFFNYHPITMVWLDTRKLKRNLGFVITMVLEVSPNNPFVMCPRNDFSAYCVLDPTIRSTEKNVVAFPRPLEKYNGSLKHEEKPVPVIGTFGYATKGKGFETIVEAVNKEFDEAIIRMNIPHGDFVPDSEAYANYISRLCKERAKKGVDVQVTHDFMSKDELIEWCSENSVNCFLYDRNMPGLSATTDQAIVSERPLVISSNETFRHILAYLPPYPEWSLKESLHKSGDIVKKIKADWQPENFLKRFEDTIFLQVPQGTRQKNTAGKYQLPIRQAKLKRNNKLLTKAGSFAKVLLRQGPVSALELIYGKAANFFKKDPNAFIKLLVENGNLKHGENCRFQDFAVFYNGERIKGFCNIEIGDNCDLHCQINLLSNKAKVKIGNDVFIGGSGSTLFCYDNIVIGDHVLISWGCSLIDNNTHSLKSSERKTDVVDWMKGIKNWSVVEWKKITVESDCWIGFNSIISKGVTLGKGSIVASGSVVTKSTEPFSVVGGNPARFIKTTE